MNASHDGIAKKKFMLRAFLDDKINGFGIESLTIFNVRIW